MPYLTNVLLLHLMPLDHRSSLEGTAVFVIVESLLAEKMGLLFSLCVLQVLFMFGYSFLLLFLRRAVVLIHFLHAHRGKTKTSLRITVTQDLEDRRSWLLLCHSVHRGRRQEKNSLLSPISPHHPWIQRFCSTANCECSSSTLTDHSRNAARCQFPC